MKIARQEGVALLLTLVMLLVVSLLAASLMFSAQSETWSSMNYRLMTQAKYGAEAGIHQAADYLLNTYAAPGTAADPIGAYDITASPVKANNQGVVLSSEATVAANYPVPAVSDAFSNAARGTFTAGNSVVTYTASASLTSMEQVTIYGVATPVAVQTWTITGYGTITGARNARIEVSTVMERLVVPVFTYAAFATSPNCAAMQWKGNPKTDSYDSGAIVWAGGQPKTDASNGDVGTNGNLTESGTATINGTLSTPRSGVGACSAGNVTALTSSGGASVSGGIIHLPQAVNYTTPDLPNPLPPTTALNINSNVILAPGDYGNIRTSGGATIHLQAGHYSINSIDLQGNSTIIIDSGPVVVDVVGAGKTTPLDLTGGTLMNGTMDPSNFQMRYAGSDTIKMAGGTQTAVLVYAPNATAELTGGTDWYGALIVKTLNNGGGVNVHYDRRLRGSQLTLGNAMMSGFTWKKF